MCAALTRACVRRDAGEFDTLRRELSTVSKVVDAVPFPGKTRGRRRKKDAKEVVDARMRDLGLWLSAVTKLSGTSPMLRVKIVGWCGDGQRAQGW